MTNWLWPVLRMCTHLPDLLWLKSMSYGIRVSLINPLYWTTILIAAVSSTSPQSYKDNNNVCDPSSAMFLIVFLGWWWICDPSTPHWYPLYIIHRWPARVQCWRGHIQKNWNSLIYSDFQLNSFNQALNEYFPCGRHYICHRVKWDSVLVHRQMLKQIM